MSLIARCPACTTLFRVVPDQLKISDGWVRCGQCAEVFDATLTLQAAPGVPQEASELLAEADAADTVPLADAEPEPEPEPEPAVDPEPVTVWSDHDEPLLAPGPLAGDTPAEPAHPMADGAESEAAMPASPPAVDSPQTVEPPLQDMSFVRQARRRAFWQRRGMRVTLGVLAGALTLLLTGQMVFANRDQIASQVPVLRPALAAMCASFQCRLGPPQRIESIAIESSAFTRVRADAFRLSLTLSNQADIALALPALELTLTDLQDQPVLRRVLQPADLGPDTPKAIEARTEWTSTLTLAVAPGANPARIVGYRVLAFYP